MSQGQIRSCKMDVLQGQVKDIFKHIVDEVCAEDNWKVNVKMGVHEIDVVYGGNKIVYGATIEIPKQLAEQKYGLNYGPESSDGQKRLVPFGRSITREEAAKIKAGDTSILDSEEFKKRPAAIGIDVHEYRDKKVNDEMESRRKRLDDKLSLLGGTATAIDSTVQGIKVLEAKGKFPGGAEAVRQDLTKQAIDAIKSGKKIISYKIRLPSKSESVMPELITKIPQQQQKPQMQKPLGLMQ